MYGSDVIMMYFLSLVITNSNFPNELQKYIDNSFVAMVCGHSLRQNEGKKAMK